MRRPSCCTTFDVPFTKVGIVQPVIRIISNRQPELELFAKGLLVDVIPSLHQWNSFKILAEGRLQWTDAVQRMHDGPGTADVPFNDQKILERLFTDFGTISAIQTAKLDTHGGNTGKRYHTTMNAKGKIKTTTNRVCANCSCSDAGRKQTKTKPFKSCERCRVVFYCGRDCQRLHWKAHKKSCCAQAAEPETEK